MRCDGGVHSGEAGFVHFHILCAVLRNRLWLSKTNGADRWVAKHHGWHQLVIHLGVQFVVKQALRELTTRFYGHRSQLNAAFHDIADTVNACNVSVLELIDLDVALLIGCNARCR
ncbi:Uncharacterised protein [Vibrio cholerae]|nr:Uncharacterised protein [Vibrio cholerae]